MEESEHNNSSDEEVGQTIVLLLGGNSEHVAHKGKQVFSGENYKICDCFKEISKSLHTCAPISELPSLILHSFAQFRILFLTLSRG
mgnify:CR=1 FL=1